MLWFLSIVVWGLFANIKTILSSGGQPQTACSQLDTCGACDKHVPDAMCVHPCMPCCVAISVEFISVGIAHGLSSVVMCMAHGFV